MTPEEIALLIFLRSNGLKDPKIVENGFYVAIRPFAFTCGIIIGEVGDFTSYSDRWCYHSYETAKAALDAWDGTGEPTGWHRHPSSGRRICETPGEFDGHGCRVTTVGAMYVRA